MDLKWKIPQNLIPLLIRILASAGILGILYAGICIHALILSPATTDTFADVEETINETVATEMKTETDTTTTEKTKTGSFNAFETEIILYEFEDSSSIVPYADSTLEDNDTILSKDVISTGYFQTNYLEDLTEEDLSWLQLEEELTSLTESYSGEWSVYVKDLSS